MLKGISLQVHTNWDISPGLQHKDKLMRKGKRLYVKRGSVRDTVGRSHL